MVSSLADITHLIIDMDGVLYRGDQPMPSLREFMAFLRERPVPFVLATNNSTRTPQEYADKLAGMGVTVAAAEILVSGQATARYLARDVGSRGVRVNLVSAGPIETGTSAGVFTPRSRPATSGSGHTAS